MLAFDLAGRQLWKVKVGQQAGNRRWGSGSSPVLHKNLVIVNTSEQLRRSRQMASPPRRDGAGGPAGPEEQIGGPGGRDGVGRQRPVNPITEALDLNHDGTIDADEIAKASGSLKKLDKNGDGKLTPDEHRPSRSGGRGDQGGRGGPGGPGSRGGPGDRGGAAGEGLPQRPDIEK